MDRSVDFWVCPGTITSFRRERWGGREERKGGRRREAGKEGQVQNCGKHSGSHEQGRLVLYQNSSLFKLLNTVVLPSLSCLKLQDCSLIWMSLVFTGKVGATPTSTWMSRACSFHVPSKEHETWL